MMKSCGSEIRTRIALRPVVLTVRETEPVLTLTWTPTATSDSLLDMPGMWAWVLVPVTRARARPLKFMELSAFWMGVPSRRNDFRPFTGPAIGPSERIWTAVPNSRLLADLA